jgi:hypothetical protein
MKMLLLVLLFSPLFVTAQEADYVPNIPIDSGAHKICFSGVVKVDGVSKDRIFSRAKDWITRNYDMVLAVIVMDDPASGHLTARSRMFGSHERGLITINTPYELSFTIDLKVKDGKYRYEITDFHEVDGVNGLMPNAYAADRFVNDPQYRNKKGVYDRLPKQHLYFIEGNSKNIILQLKAGILSDKFDHQPEADF